MNKPNKPCICLIEDDPLRRSLVIEAYEFEFVSEFDLRFVVCEQHFFDLFGDHLNVTNHYFVKKSDVRWVPVWNPTVDSFPALFVVDMMVSWDDKDYKSDREQPTFLARHRAGLRIAQQLVRLKNKQRVRWFYWTAIDCQDMEHELNGAELIYKDYVDSHTLFDKYVTKYLKSK